MFLLQEIIFYLYGGISAVMDLRLRAIGLRSGIFTATLGTVLYFVQGGTLTEFLLSLIPGTVILIISAASRGNVGSGDALFVVICGIFTGFEKTVFAAISAWFLCAVIGLFVCVVRFTDRSLKKATLPFVTVVFAVLIIMEAAENFF